ncbi:MAG: hypothetical protein Q9208_005550 [Pyrenodesmia sp. 3 TL-2023]
MANMCASCGENGHLVCNGCARAPAYLEDTAPATYYCDAGCQKAHWAQHKERCKLLQRRTMLHRAAKVIQDLYYIVLRKSFRHSVEKVDRVDENTMFVHTTNPDCGVHGKNSILPDPRPGSLSSNRADELAALTMNGCGNSVATMGPSVQIMLQGELASTLGGLNLGELTGLLSDIMPFIYECQLIAMNRKLWGITVCPDGSIDFTSKRIDKVDQHEVLFVMMNSPGIPVQDQERYAIDLTHAQYGHHDETLMPWKTYVETRVHSNSGQRPLGWTRENLRKLMVENLGEEGRMLQVIVGQFGDAITAAVRDFPGWMKVWKEKDEAAYQRQVEHILQHVTTRLDRFVASKANDEDYKLWSSTAERRLMQTNTKRMRKEKLELWGQDLRGPAFVSAMKLIKARQAKERGSWGTPEAEKKRMEMHLIHTLEGTDYKGPKPDIQQFVR